MGTEGTRQQAYCLIARKAIEYIDACAKRGMVPLGHDARVFKERLSKAKNSKELK